MKHFFLFFFFVLLSIVGKTQENQKEFEVKEGDTTFIMKEYYFLIYLSGPERNQDSATLAQLQKGHLDHINKMADDGVICIAGPFGDKTEKRGILIFDTATIEEAIKWAEMDPMVKAKRLSYEIHPWWGAKGSILK